MAICRNILMLLEALEYDKFLLDRTHRAIGSTDLNDRLTV